LYAKAIHGKLEPKLVQKRGDEFDEGKIHIVATDCYAQGINRNVGLVLFQGVPRTFELWYQSMCRGGRWAPFDGFDVHVIQVPSLRLRRQKEHLSAIKNREANPLPNDNGGTVRLMLEAYAGFDQMCAALLSSSTQCLHVGIDAYFETGAKVAPCGDQCSGCRRKSGVTDALRPLVTLGPDSTKKLARALGKLFNDGQIHSRDQVTTAMKGSTEVGAGVPECRTNAHADYLAFALESLGVLVPVATLTAVGARQAALDGKDAPLAHLPKHYDLQYQFNSGAFVSSGVGSLLDNGSEPKWLPTLPVVRFGRKKNASRDSTGSEKPAQASRKGTSVATPLSTNGKKKKKPPKKPTMKGSGGGKAASKPKPKTSKGSEALPPSFAAGGKRKQRAAARGKARSTRIALHDAGDPTLPPSAGVLHDATNEP
jgi:hypothetical protein